MPLDVARDFAGAIVAAAVGLFAAIWSWLVMFFSMRSEVVRAHARIDSIDRKVNESHAQLMRAIEQHEARNLDRDIRIEDKLDRLIERRGVHGG